MPSSRHDGWYRELVIKFEDDSEERFFIEMSRSGTFMLSDLQQPAEWTRLEFHKCKNCPLAADVEYCPAAESLENTLMRFRDRYSYEHVEAIAVDDANRRTVIEGTLQEVGSVFVQLAVFSSGCPLGKRLRPLLTDIRPFATNNELTRHLIYKILLQNQGQVDQAREHIAHRVEPLHEIFSNLWKRFDDHPHAGDAVQNSIVRMDAFTLNVSLQLNEILDELVSDMGWDDPPEGNGDGNAKDDHGAAEQTAAGGGEDAVGATAEPDSTAGEGAKRSWFGRLKRLFGG